MPLVFTITAVNEQLGTFKYFYTPLSMNEGMRDNESSQLDSPAVLACFLEMKRSFETYKTLMTSYRTGEKGVELLLNMLDENFPLSEKMKKIEGQLKRLQQTETSDEKAFSNLGDGAGYEGHELTFNLLQKRKAVVALAEKNLQLVQNLSGRSKLSNQAKQQQIDVKIAPEMAKAAEVSLKTNFLSALQAFQTEVGENNYLYFKGSDYHRYDTHTQPLFKELKDASQDIAVLNALINEKLSTASPHWKEWRISLYRKETFKPLLEALHTLVSAHRDNLVHLQESQKPFWTTKRVALSILTFGIYYMTTLRPIRKAQAVREAQATEWMPAQSVSAESVVPGKEEEVSLLLTEERYGPFFKPVKPQPQKGNTTELTLQTGPRPGCKS